MKWRSVGAVLMSCVVLLCSGSIGRLPSVDTSHAVVASVREVALPNLTVPDYLTLGNYPQLASTELHLAAANAGIRLAIRKDERTFASWASQEEKTHGINTRRIIRAAYGVYEIRLPSQQLAVNSALVSMLLEKVTGCPSGCEWVESWLAITVTTSSGANVALAKQLFRDPNRATAALAHIVQREVLSGKSDAELCIQNAKPEQGYTTTLFVSDDLALTVHGLAVGLPEGQIGPDSCGALQVTVPYDDLTLFLSTSGSSLVRGLSSPSS